MPENPLKQLEPLGQSIWLDYIRRDLLTSGGLKRLIDEDGIRGVTSNPTIFEKAISGSQDYDQQLQQLVSEGCETPEILDALTIQDIQMAADIFKPVYDETEGKDGFISLEVSPLLAHQRDATIQSVQETHARVNRPNVMIKVPATPEGIQAHEVLIGMGISINMTLIFSIATYEAVAKSYLAGLKKRHQTGQDLRQVQSVASVFVSRIDTLSDQIIAARIQNAKFPEEAEVLKSLTGKIAIANSKIIYKKFKALFQGPSFRALAEAGASAQRPLWASTGTKNPDYSDVRYVEELIGAQTVNTVPPATMDAFRDHGNPDENLEKDLSDAEETLTKLDAVGIDLKEITDQLQTDGVKAFATSFQNLSQAISEKRTSLMTSPEKHFSARLGDDEAPVQETLRSLEALNLEERIWAADASLWKSDPDIQGKINNRLGWLCCVEKIKQEVKSLTKIARLIKNSGMRHVVLLGMGGSSLCPEVLRKTFGSAAGFPDLIVLDTTDPETIILTERRIDLVRTIFIVASKSGSTIETMSLYRYFFAKIRKESENPGERFIAITDPGSQLSQIAEEERFLMCFLTPPDVGGRYSALTYFGLVPAALIGIDLAVYLERAEARIQASGKSVPLNKNAAIRLGAILGTLGKSGRDKVTLITSSVISSFGLWVEQLVAESIGKEGQSLVPIDGEAVGDPKDYGKDRLFVFLSVDSDPDEDLERKVAALENVGHPVVRIRLKDPLDLAGEFFRWEMATAVAGVVYGINPFDEPNVSESKANTAKVLEAFQESGVLALPEPELEEGGIFLVGDLNNDLAGSFAEGLGSFLNQAQVNDYVALMAWFSPSERHDALLQTLRKKIGSRYRLATTLGYGPRFLHSTGQLHKGGGGNGLFLQITAGDKEDRTIPEAPYSFGILKRAQALGDFHSLTGKGLRAIEIRLGKNIEEDLRKVLDAIY